MLANTISLTVGAAPAVTLLRVREDGGQSIYRFRSPGLEYELDVRQTVATQKGGVVYNQYNMLLTTTIAGAAGEDAVTFTSSFTGRFPVMADPAKSSDLQSALFTVGTGLLASLVQGEL